jgi:hypothetical protein
VGDCVVDRHAGRKGQAYIVLERLLQERISTGLDLTFVHFGSLYIFVVHASSTLLDKFVAFDTEIDHFRSLNGELDELLQDLMDNIRCCLKPKR